LETTGVPRPLLETTRSSARVVGAPYVLVPALIWPYTLIDPVPTVVEQLLPPYNMLGRGIPSYALDIHTAAGKSAIRNFVKECEDIRRVLIEHVADFRMIEAGGIAAFYADAAPVARRYDWSGSI